MKYKGAIPMLLQTTPGTAHQWHALADRVLAGEPPTAEEALAVLNVPDTQLLDLLAAAFRIRQYYFGTTVKLNYLVNAKSGICPEDCSYCSQSRVSDAEIERYPLLTSEELLARAERAVALKASTCCIVTSGKRPSERELQILADTVRTIKARYPGLSICASLGRLAAEEAELLHDAGVGRYNHNLNTSEPHYSNICSTHTFADRVETVQNAAAAGMSPCSGVIVGMGERLEDIVSVAFHLRDIQADSIPINTLLPIPGTPLEDGAAGIDPRFCLKVLAMFRFVCPDREIRVSAGREQHFRALQPLSLYAANSLFVGDYLTTAGQQAEMDWQMIADLGFEIETVQEDHQ
jgi:biotin synthase